MPPMQRFFAPLAIPRGLSILWVAAVLMGCGGGSQTLPAPEAAPPTIDIHLLAFNDLHGHLEPPGLQAALPLANGQRHTTAVGGMAWLAGTIDALRAQYPHHAVVSAGDMVGSSPLLSSFFLDEPTVEAANAMGVDFAAVGNHEFDRGWPEMLRLAHGGCAVHTARTPCQLNPQFAGAQFPWLAANVWTEDGRTVLPATGLKTFREGGHQVTVGFIGMTLQDTPRLVMAPAVQGLRFTGEAETANALVPQLLAQGAELIVVLLHEGASTTGDALVKGCEGLSGGILPVLEQLDPRISVVISGHTHQSYVCDYATRQPGHRVLLTSAGLHGTQLTDITLRWDPVQRRLESRSARPLAVVAGDSPLPAPSDLVVPQVQPHAQVQALIARYREVVAQQSQAVVGQIDSPGHAPLSHLPTATGEVVLGRLIADAQHWAMQSPQLGGADMAFMHSGGIRAALQPGADGSVTYGQLYAVQPFGNTLVGMTLTGAQIVQLLEDTYTVPLSASGRTRVLSANAALRWQHDPQAPAGARVQAVWLHGVPLQASAPYRVVVSSFLADGGDRYAVLGAGTARTQGPVDIDALEAYVRAHSPLPVPHAARIDSPGWQAR